MLFFINLSSCFSLIAEHGIQFSQNGYCINNFCNDCSRLHGLFGFVRFEAIICYIYYRSTSLCEKLLKICILFVISFVSVAYVLRFKISLLRIAFFMYSKFSGTASWSLQALKRLLFKIIIV